MICVQIISAYCATCGRQMYRQPTEHEVRMSSETSASSIEGCERNRPWCCWREV